MPAFDQLRLDNTGRYPDIDAFAIRHLNTFLSKRYPLRALPDLK